MSLSSATTGQAIADYVVSVRPAAGHEMTDVELATMWKGIIAIIYADFAAHALVAPGSFSNPAGAVTGVGGPIT